MLNVTEVEDVGLFWVEDVALLEEEEEDAELVATLEEEDTELLAVEAEDWMLGR